MELATCPVEADDTHLLREALEAVVEGVAESKQEKCRRSLDLIGEDRPGSGEDASLAWPERFPHDRVGDRLHQRVRTTEVEPALVLLSVEGDPQRKGFTCQWPEAASKAAGL